MYQIILQYLINQDIAMRNETLKSDKKHVGIITDIKK